MLSLQLKSGDYLTIGEDVVIQVFQEAGSRFRVSINAPREVPIVRGEVREREGEKRPEGLRDSLPPNPSSRRHTERRARERLERLEEYRQAAAERSDAVRRLRALLDASELPDRLRQPLEGQLERLERAERALGKERGADGENGDANPQHHHQGAPLSDRCAGGTL